MPYKCEYDFQFACGNCKHCRTSICYECRKRTEYACPLGKGKTYPEGRKVCRKCLFEPKSEETNMIMTEEELDEQIAMYEAEEAKRLKPCKRCGIIPQLVRVGTNMYEATCECGRRTAICGSEKKAIEEWNNNVADLGGKFDSMYEIPLKPCKCGAMPHLETMLSIPQKYFYRCPVCGMSSFNRNTEAEARNEWNEMLYGINCAIKDSGERREFETGAVRDMAEGKGLMVVMPAAALLRLSLHYEHGAKKYGKFNWQKGIPVSSFMDSALRHIMKYLDGWDDEDHLAAAAFNILGAMEMEAHKPAMQDIPAREGAKSFNYKKED